ncbi:MAG TPA: hypothetical protein VGG19_05675 [Tepidisphaeraceae bacterium]
MNGITTALVVFILIGVSLPAMIRNKTQFYCAVAFVAGAILVSPFSFNTFCAFLVAILQMLAFIALILCAGGLEVHEFANHMVDAYEAVRHGEKKPVIVPRTGEMPKEKPIDPTIVPPPPPPQPATTPDNLSSIPLEPKTEEIPPNLPESWR